MKKQKNIWILTEERPKKEVLKIILEKFITDYKLCSFVDTIRIFPILNNDEFTFTYEITGFRCHKIDRIYLKTISGKSSCVDFLIFYQRNQPKDKDNPIYAIEETKTDDKESRNTGVYQRASKFVFINYYYPKVRKIMLYNLKTSQKKTPTDTYIFGTKLLLSLGVEIIGKSLDPDTFVPFKTIKDIIDFKNNMKKAPTGNTPITIEKSNDTIKISGKLDKNKRLSHDPNIGALSIISAIVRKLNWKKKIIITNHGLKQRNIGATNKFIKIANRLNISLENLKIPKVKEEKNYWQYDTTGEKLGTIFVHLIVENFTNGYSVFENHAGCERGYFLTKQGSYIPIEKYKDREKYKSGDKNQIIHIPDLILIDFDCNTVINIEGKKYTCRRQGIEELENYETIEKEYISKHYPKFDIVRTLVLYGSKEEKIEEIEVGFLLNEKGKLILGIKSPMIFKKAIKNLLDFWK